MSTLMSATAKCPVAVSMRRIEVSNTTNAGSLVTVKFSITTSKGPCFGLKKTKSTSAQFTSVGLVKVCYGEHCTLVMVRHGDKEQKQPEWPLKSMAASGFWHCALVEMMIINVLASSEPMLQYIIVTILILG